MSILKRLFKIGQSEAHAALDNLEDPIRMAEQGIRDLKKDLTESLQGLAGVKAQAIRAKREETRLRESAEDYERKAVMLIHRAETGQMEAADADRLAGEALQRRDQMMERLASTTVEVDNFERMTGKLDNNIQNLKSQVAKWENELSTLKARAQVGRATRKLNEQLAKVDSGGTIAMLEKMKEKVHEEEALAEAYGEIAGAPGSVDDEINAALEGPSQSASLADLKLRMGLDKVEVLAAPKK